MNDSNNNGNNDASQSESCSFCVASPPKNAYYCVHIVNGSSKSTCLYAKSRLNRGNLLRGAMTLRGDGVVLGEIKGEVYSRGQEELVKGECGLEAVSDDDDDEDACRHSDSKGKSRVEVGTRLQSAETSSRDGNGNYMSVAPGGSAEMEETHRHRRYGSDQRSLNFKKNSNGGRPSQKPKSSPRPPPPPLPPRGMSWTVPMIPFPCAPPLGHQRPFARHPHPFHPFHPHIRSPRGHPRFAMADMIRPLNPEGSYRDIIENSTLTP